ncbi:MAG: hypothetical protein JWN04_4624 [Myxococcaceae bacterium]|nr:hypothetical protein [Myxococcaceae bacterium]
MPFIAFASLPKLLRHVARMAIVCLCASLVLPSARADDDSGLRTPPRAALDHYDRGRAHYQAGRYQEAVVELERALELDPDSPNLLYNLARVYELLGNIERSIAYYQRYYAMLPAGEAEERERVAGTIHRLEGAKSQPLRPPETRTIPVVLPTQRGVADGAFWTLASLSLAALVAGTVTGGLALREQRATQTFVLGRDGDVAEREAHAKRADRLALTSDVSIATGAIGGLTSVLLYALRSRPVVSPSVAVVQHGLMLSLRGQL